MSLRAAASSTSADDSQEPPGNQMPSNPLTHSHVALNEKHRRRRSRVEIAAGAGIESAQIGTRPRRESLPHSPSSPSLGREIYRARETETQLSLGPAPGLPDLPLAASPLNNGVMYRGGLMVPRLGPQCVSVTEPSRQWGGPLTVRTSL